MKSTFKITYKTNKARFTVILFSFSLGISNNFSNICLYVMLCLANFFKNVREIMPCSLVKNCKLKLILLLSRISL